MTMKKTTFVFRIATMLLGGTSIANALRLDLTSDASIKSVTSTIAYDMMSYYKGNLSGQIPGLLPLPQEGGYYWWEAGAMFGSMIDYWYYTGDSSYNNVTMQALLFQVGPNQDYMPPNETYTLGNDDQGFWGMAAMTAAETNFQNPPPDQPQWLALAQAVYNRQADPNRHDDTCGGGMRWQIYEINGYDYKNAIANGIFINLGARLAMYTGNNSYTDWVEKTWKWVTDTGIIDSNYTVYDGVHVENCSVVSRLQFSYNTAIYLLTAATMYNYTNGSSLWYNRTDGILNKTLDVFFPNNIAYEVSCEAGLTCNTDMFSQKAYLTRWMAQTTKLAPFTFDRVKKALEVSAAAAALQCSGGPNGRMCGLSWSKGATWDGTMGVGQQMAAMEVIQSNLIQQAKAPVTNSTGGTSPGNPSAGTKPDPSYPDEPPTTGAKVGASILTAVLLLLAVSMWSWMTI